MHLKIGGVLLSAPPDFDGVQVDELVETQQDINLEGLPFQRVSEKRYFQLTLQNTPQNGINRDERIALDELRVGDTVTVEENYSRREIRVWAGCAITSKRPFPRIIKDNQDSSETGDFFGWGFTLTFVEA